MAKTKTKTSKKKSGGFGLSAELEAVLGSPDVDELVNEQIERANPVPPSGTYTVTLTKFDARVIKSKKKKEEYTIMAVGFRVADVEGDVDEGYQFVEDFFPSSWGSLVSIFNVGLGETLGGKATARKLAVGLLKLIEEKALIVIQIDKTTRDGKTYVDIRATRRLDDSESEEVEEEETEEEEEEVEEE